MRICCDLNFVFHPGASDEDNALVLRIWLEALIAANRVYLQGHPNTPPLYKSGVTYGRTRVWDSIPDMYARGYGDCKSLTAALVAEMRQAGKSAKPVFRFLQRQNTGQRDFHILVQVPGGFEDPSRVLGMEEYHRSRRIPVYPQ